MPKISCSIVLNFDPKDEVEYVVKKLINFYSDIKICIVDNGKNFRDYLSGNKNIIYIHNKRHIGYARAHNLAINKFINESEFHLITNVDILFENNIILELLKFMELNPNCGMVGPKIINSDKTIYNSLKFFPKPSHIFIRKFMKNYFKKHLTSYIINNDSIKKEIKGNFISGCFMFLRSDILRKINLFDDNYFLNFDDLDLCRKVIEETDIYYNPNISLIHNHGQDHVKSLKVTMISLKSTIYYFSKWGWFFDKKRKKYNDQLRSRLTFL